ncbi:MAG: phosphopantetheine-binding protein [Acetatifactor sp.]
MEKIGKEELEKKVLELVQSMAMEGITVAQEDFLVDIGFNSLTKVDLILAVEEEFNIEFCDEDLQPRKLKSVKDLISIVGVYLSVEGIEELKW